MRRWIVCVAVLGCAVGHSAAQPAASNVRLDLVTYQQLGDEVKNLRGKVILIDFWADFCQPCKQKFPYVQALQQKYANEGVVVITVSVDDVKDPQVRENVKAFLQQQRATSRNLLLAEDPKIWIAKLKMDSVPTMFLFDRDGRLINRWTGAEIDLAAIEKRIVELAGVTTAKAN